MRTEIDFQDRVADYFVGLDDVANDLVILCCR